MLLMPTLKAWTLCTVTDKTISLHTTQYIRQQKFVRFYALFKLFSIIFFTHFDHCRTISSRFAKSILPALGEPAVKRERTTNNMKSWNCIGLEKSLQIILIGGSCQQSKKIDIYYVITLWKIFKWVVLLLINSHYA